MVGSMVARFRPPPHTSRAPCLWASAIQASTRSASASLMSDEMSLASSNGCPMTSFRVAAANFSKNASAIDSCA